MQLHPNRGGGRRGGGISIKQKEAAGDAADAELNVVADSTRRARFNHHERPEIAAQTV